MSSAITPNVAIIGAGLSGLTTCKSALECGLRPIVFERGSMISGGWSREGFIPEEMRTNISSDTCMFSDFKWKKETPDFPDRKAFDAYLCQYAETFQIHPHVQLHSEVQKIRQSGKKWTVEWLNNSILRSEVFDYVIVCTGFFSKAFIPKIPGMGTFSGTIYHSKEYKTPDPFKGKRVIVIGNAFSGCDIAASIANKANRVFHTFQTSKWILPRYLRTPLNTKTPADLIYYSRAANARSIGIDSQILNIGKNTWFQSICSQQATLPGLVVNTPLSEPPFVTVSDSYLEQVQEQNITIKQGSIQKIEDETVIFQDGSTINTDALVFCTGYQTALSFFDQPILDLLGYEPENQFQPLLLHKTVFPSSRLQGLACVGLYRGPFPAAVELQGRWACMAFSNKIPFPTDAEIEAGIQRERDIRNASPRPQFPHEDYVGLCEDLAAQIGVLPNFEKLKTENPVLYDKLWNGPFTSASYRLEGFGNNPQLALEIIEEIYSKNPKN